MLTIRIKRKMAVWFIAFCSTGLPHVVTDNPSKGMNNKSWVVKSETSLRFPLNTHCWVSKFCPLIDRSCMRYEGEQGCILIRNDPKTKWLKTVSHWLFHNCCESGIQEHRLGLLLQGLPEGCAPGVGWGCCLISSSCMWLLTG